MEASTYQYMLDNKVALEWLAIRLCLTTVKVKKGEQEKSMDCPMVSEIVAGRPANLVDEAWLSDISGKSEIVGDTLMRLIEIIAEGAEITDAEKKRSKPLPSLSDTVKESATVAPVQAVV